MKLQQRERTTSKGGILEEEVGAVRGLLPAAQHERREHRVVVVGLVEEDLEARRVRVRRPEVPELAVAELLAHGVVHARVLVVRPQMLDLQPEAVPEPRLDVRLKRESD